MNNTVMIVAARRTPLGSFQGQFASLSATDLGAIPVRAVVDDAAIDKGIIDEVIDRTNAIQLEELNRF